MEEIEIYFIMGFTTCMICDVLFSIANFFIQKALYIRALKKAVKK